MARKVDVGLGLFVFRTVVGFLFGLHGTVKIFGWPADAGPTAEFGAWPSWWIGLISLTTGLLVMIGLFTRAAAFLASGAMAVAYFWKHQPDGLLPIQNGGETAALFSFAFLLLAFTGSGACAVGNLTRGRTAHVREVDAIDVSSPHHREVLPQ
ncbi:DoxX family protein [Mycobacterium sp. 4D054]|uniref:DoxX family protein n=1 Tax=unclassified Mycobacterium TaxID=2642494 RepID=UPI0021B2A8EF|nr:DoxX family protein [Mycobacterium sp. SMC-8]UXA11243.1 DoxX family protein [Mycobacterium sp. SMC-8]